MINTDVDRNSFADSDQFEDDSVNSWLSDSEDQINNWRGWKKVHLSGILHPHRERPVPGITGFTDRTDEPRYYRPEKLINQAAKVVAVIQPGFDLTERGVPFPEELIKLIAFYSFPSSEEEIRLYSCLGCGNIDEFIRGENLYKTKGVRECLQIGFHLSAKVLRRPTNIQSGNAELQVSYDNNGFNYAQYISSSTGITSTASPTESNVKQMQSSAAQGNISSNQSIFNNICKVGITFDRGRITSCHCSCDYLECIDKVWCSHVVATCLYRIHEAKHVQIRAPISESLSKLTKEDLQKFSQFLISKMNLADILPAAQNILDELLASTNNPMKSVRGAPDLTAGASSEDQPNWFFDQLYIQDNISKILQKFCVPKPVVYGDPRHLSNNLPIVAQEYQNILRPMRGKEPEGIWNLTSIIRDMFRREDTNAITLLRILSNCLLESKPIIMWWYCIKLNQELCLKSSSQSNSSLHSQYASAYFCDEMVELWRIAVLRFSLLTCKFATSRRLQAHMSEQTNDTIFDLLKEIKSIHQAVIKTAILCLDKQLNRTSFNFNNLNFARHSTGSNVPANNPNVSLMSESSQRQFIGFKPAIEACRMYIELKKTAEQQATDVDDFRPISPQDFAALKEPELVDFYCGKSDDEHGAMEMDEISDLNEDSKQNYPNAELDEPDVHLVSNFMFDDIKKEFDSTDLKYMQCESLYYYGYSNESAQLAYELAENLLERKGIICESLYKAARLSLIDNHQKLSELNHISQSHAQQHSQPNGNGKSHLATGSKGFRRYRSFNYNLGNGGNSVIAHSGNLCRPLDDQGDSDHVYEAKVLLKRIQFLINCLVSDNIDLTKIPPLKRFDMPNRSRLTEIAFHLLLFALQLPRPAAPSKNLEINMIQLEIDLLIQAQQVRWRDYVPNFRCLLIDIALQLKNKTLPYLTDVHIPYNLASFIFEQLTGINGGSPTEFHAAANANNNKCRQRLFSRERTRSRLSQADPMDHSMTDEFDGNIENTVAFESALSVLGMRSKVPEQLNTILVEGQRRLRDEFAAFLLNVYKDDIDKLTLILGQLLDSSLNPHFKAAPLKFYLSNSLNKMLEPLEHSEDAATIVSADITVKANEEFPVIVNKDVSNSFECQGDILHVFSDIPSEADLSASATDSKGIDQMLPMCSSTLRSFERPMKQSPQTKSKPKIEKNNQSVDTDSSALEDDNSETSCSEKKQWEQKFRCLTISKRLSTNQHSTGMAAIDSSAPETTESSDNSPTTIRKRILPESNATALYNVTVNGIPCGADQPGKTEIESFDEKAVEEEPTKASTDLPFLPTKDTNGKSSRSTSLSDSSSHLSPASPPLSAQPQSKACSTCKEIVADADKEQHRFAAVTEAVTESLAHHMFELAQTVLQKAGIPDDAATPIFRVNNSTTNTTLQNNTSSVQAGQQGSSSSSHLAAQRNLQLCAFQLGLYALGLYNQLNALWQSRTYSSHVAWISTQIVEFGVSAACVLLHSWRHHLNPSEVAEIAYRVSKRRDSHMSRVGAELCLAVLAESSTLNPNQILRGLRQCNDQSNEMLERALLSVERGANNSLSGVQPVIYFHLAQAWYQLYKADVGVQPMVTSGGGSFINSQNATVVTCSNQSPSSFQQQQHNGNGSIMAATGIPQFMNGHGIPGVIISQSPQQISSVSFPNGPFVSPLPLANHAAVTNTPWIYGNMIASSGAIAPSSLIQTNFLPQLPYMPQIQLMSIRGLPPGPVQQVSHTAHIQPRQAYFYHSPAVSQSQLQPLHPSSTVFSNVSTTIGSTSTLRSPVTATAGVASNAIPLPTGAFVVPQAVGIVQAPVADNRTHDYLLRAFNSAMKAIHILFQLQTSTTVSNESAGTMSTSSGSATSRRQQIIFNNGGGGGSAPANSSDIADYPTTALSDCLNHDANIRWTLKIAKLLGADEVNRYCTVILQFIQSPFLMKEIVLEVMEFYHLTHVQQAISADLTAPVSQGCPGVTANLIGNASLATGPGPGLPSGIRQQGGMILSIPAAAGNNYSLMRTGGASIGFPTIATAVGLQHSSNFSGHPVTQPLQAGHSFNLSMPMYTLQLGVEMVHKMTNRLHYLFRRMIEKRLQQTGQGPRDWDSLVELILEAYRAQRTLPATDPNLTWVEILQKIKSNRKCTKDLWARICTGLQTVDQL